MYSLSVEFCISDSSFAAHDKTFWGYTKPSEEKFPQGRQSHFHSQDMRQAPFNYIFGLKHLTMHAEAPYHARRATARQENAGKAVLEETPEDSRENSEEVIKENVEREASEAPKDVIDTENVDVQLVNDYFYPDPDKENSTVVLELTNLKLKVELLHFHEFEIQWKEKLGDDITWEGSILKKWKL